ncbi:MAG: UDP-N-acetylmuramate--L-alanine ligase [Oscillospiraceae bacterium]
MVNKNLLQGKKHLHFIGIGGSGMYPLVQILQAAGYTISGSDVNEGDIINYERAMGIKVYMPQSAENVHGADLVVYSAAINMANPEIVEAQRLGIETIERSIMLGYVTALYSRPICIAGTHGKTSTTAMATQALLTAKVDTAAVIGGKLPFINGYGKAGTADCIVVESCEYHNTFLELTPHTAVLLNVDADHLEFFGNMANLKTAFRKFCQSATDTVIYNKDDANTCEVVNGLTQNLVSFGKGEGCDFRAVNINEPTRGFYAFDILHNGKKSASVALGAPGAHQVLNALACFSACVLEGADPTLVAKGISAFGGAGRRFEVLGNVRGITIADDYAHHPTELTATLTAAKEMGFANVWAVFQPFTFSRTKMLLDDFAESLQIADKVVMTEIMGSRETNEKFNIFTADLAAKIPNSVWFKTFDEVSDYVMQHAKENDLVITLGCGDIYKAAKMMLKK